MGWRASPVGVAEPVAALRRGTLKGTEESNEAGKDSAPGVRATDYGAGTALRRLEKYPGGRRCRQASNSALERTAGSHSLVAAAHRERSADKE